MDPKKTALTAAVATAVTLVLLTVAAFVVPWHLANWGVFQYGPQPTVTVTGEAHSETANQLATFTAGVNTVSDNKQQAIDDANKTIAAIIAAAATLGIPKQDVKTQNMSVFQSEESYYDGGIQKQRAGQWRVSNTVEIKVRDLSRAGELTDAVTKAGANQVYGPNFTTDDTTEAQNALFGKAIQNARTKAALVARESGHKLGSMLTVTEEGSSAPVLYGKATGMGGGGGPVEAGSATVSKTVSVTFELK